MSLLCLLLIIESSACVLSVCVYTCVIHKKKSSCLICPHHSSELMCTVDSALSESAALWALLAALQRPQPQVQVCDASSWRLWPLCLLQRMVINYPLPPLLYYIKKLTCPINILFIARWWSFDDMNLERLRLTMAMKTPEDHMFNFDPKTIDWDHYFTRIHIPGVLKYLCKWSLPLKLLRLHLV